MLVFVLGHRFDSHSQSSEAFGCKGVYVSLSDVRDVIILGAFLQDTDLSTFGH